MTSFRHPDYILLELIYEDLVSFLHRGIHQPTQTPVVVWEYKKEYLTPALTQELSDNAIQLAAIHHPGLLGIRETVVYDGSFFVISDAPESWSTLEEYLTQSHPSGQLWQFSIRLLETLRVLEQHGVVCGSLAPSQVWVDGSGAIFFSRVSIPIAILKGQWDRLPVLDDAIFYPPEFLQRGEYTVRSDIYGFGVLMYGLCGKGWPYTRTHLVDKVQKELLQPPQPFVRRFSGLPDRIAALVQTCLAKEPALRFTGFEEMIYRYNQQKILPIPVSMESPIEHELKQSVSRDTRQKRSKWIRIALIIGIVLLAGVALREGYTRMMFKRESRMIPNVVGLTVEQAQSLLMQNNLEGQVVGFRVDPLLPEGIVVETRPSAGREVKETRLVQLIVSKGQGDRRVPNLVGKTLDQIASFLPETITVNVVQQQYSPIYPKGTILSQNPSSNSLLKPDQLIQLVVSAGYPMDVLIKQGPQDYMTISVAASVPEHWDPYLVDISYEEGSKRSVLLHKMLDTGESLQQEFPVKPGGHLLITIDQKVVVERRVVKSDEPSHR